MSLLPTKIDSETKNRSSLDAMCLSLDHLFYHVNSPFVDLMSTNFISSINLLKRVEAALISLTPPFFSSKDQMMLKSPPISQWSFSTHYLSDPRLDRKVDFLLGWKGP